MEKRFTALFEALVRANPERSSFELAAKTFGELGDERRAAAWRARIPR